MNRLDNTLYEHPDGFTLDFDDNSLIATDDDGKAVSLPVGSTGLVKLCHAQLALATKQEEKFTSERAGAVMGHDLINELLAVRGEPQAEAFRVFRDKLYALSKLEHFDSVAGGFAGALVNVLEIGIANLPKLKREECQMKARLYALARYLLPFLAYGAIGFLLAALPVELFGGAK